MQAGLWTGGLKNFRNFLFPKSSAKSKIQSNSQKVREVKIGFTLLETWQKMVKGTI